MSYIDLSTTRQEFWALDQQVKPLAAYLVHTGNFYSYLAHLL